MKKISSDRAVNAAVVQKADHKPVGKADNLNAGVAKPLLYAVLVGTVGVGDGDFSIPDGDGIAAAAFGFEGKLLIFKQAQGHDGIAAFDLGPGGRGARTGQKKTQAKTYSQHQSKQGDPIFGLQRESLRFGLVSPGQYSKLLKKTQEKVANSA